jgi:hypothetical protein
VADVIVGGWRRLMMMIDRARGLGLLALGNGLPLFKDLAKPLRADLAEARSFPGGTVIHVYQPIRTGG